MTNKPGAPPSPARGNGHGSSPVDLVQLEEQFERALGTVKMFFQPIVRPNGAGVFGYEALLRSSEPSLPHPGAILEAAERLNRLPALGRAIRKNVASVYHSAGDDRGIAFVNLHALDLVDKSLMSPYSPLTKISTRVVLEITERASLEGLQDIRNIVADLRQMGFRIAIDDLGAGHARMKEFSPLDTDFVKLDISVVRDIDKEPMKRSFVASIVQLCHSEDILVIGEGVESGDEAKVLVDLGCDLLQGFYFAKPGPAFPALA